MHSWKLTREQKRIILFLILLLPFFILSAKLIAAYHGDADSDFFTFWLAGRMNWTNQSPYSADQWAAGYNQFGAHWIPNEKFLYPLPLAVILAPFGLLTLHQAYTIWVVLSEIFIAVSICLILSSFLPNPKKIHFVFPLLTAAFIFRSTIVTIFNGQLGAFLLVMASLAIILWEKQKFWQSGLMLSFLALKPTIGIPIIFFVLLWQFYKKDYKHIFVMIGSGLVWVIIGVIRDPQWIPKFLENGSEKFFGNLGLFPNLWGISARVCDEQSMCTFGIGGLLSLALLAVTLHVLWTKKTASAFQIFSIIIPVSLLITPYLWAYDQILLIIPVLFVTITLYQRGYPYIISALFPIFFSLLALSFLFLAENLNQDTWSFLMPLVSMVLVLALPRAIQKPVEMPQVHS